MLQVSHVNFSYGRVPALEDVTFDVAPGEIVGLVGPNGSGKTTLIRCMFDLLRLGSGRITIDGEPHASLTARQSSVMTASNEQMSEFLTGAEYVRLVASMFGLRVTADEIAEQFDALCMPGRQDDLIEDYSHGMRKKTQLTAAFLVARPLTVIDETLNGIDLDALLVCEDALAAARRAERSVVLCSHDLSVLERVADRLILLDHGCVALEDTVAAVVAEYGSIHQLVRTHLGTNRVG